MPATREFIVVCAVAIPAPTCLSLRLTIEPHFTSSGSTLRMGSWSIRLDVARAHCALSVGELAILRLSRFAQMTLKYRCDACAGSVETSPAGLSAAPAVAVAAGIGDCTMPSNLRNAG